MYHSDPQAALNMLIQMGFSIDQRTFDCCGCGKSVNTLVRHVREGVQQIGYGRCPVCKHLTVFVDDLTVYPMHPRIDVHPDVPERYADMYRKAYLSVDFAPELSAVMSRKCLEAILEDCFEVKAGNLFDKIDKAKDRLPTRLVDQLHNLRKIGKFAAHPKNDQTTLEPLSVEPGEAEYCLGLLEYMFDESFVRPAKQKKMEANLQAKTKQLRASPS